MKILALVCYYPPYHSGGYELRCKDVLEQLKQRGHEVKIITSRVSNEAEIFYTKENNIHRQFHILDSSLPMPQRVFRDYLDVKFLDKIITSFQPDLVYLWNVVNFSRAIFPYLADREIPVVYDEGGNGLSNCWHHGGSWFSYLERESSSPYKNTLKRIVGFLVQMLSGRLIKNLWHWPDNIWVYFNGELSYSNAIDDGWPVGDSLIIHSGVDIHKFAYKPRGKIASPLSIVVPGRIEFRKGQADAVKLLMCLREKNTRANLSIVGKNNSDTYFQELKKLIGAYDLTEQVEILPMIDHIKLARLYQMSDICFFSSHATTGFSRVPLEAMACGSLVITYGNEGSNEIVQNKKTGFIVNQADFETMTDIIQDLISDAKTYQQIITNAHQLIIDEHSMETYVDKLEVILTDAQSHRNHQNPQK